MTLSKRKFLKKVNDPGYILTQRDCERLEEIRQEAITKNSRTKKEDLATPCDSGAKQVPA